MDFCSILHGLQIAEYSIKQKGSDSIIYFQIGILILEIGLCMLLNDLLNNKSNKKIRYAICIALLINCSNMHTYQAMWAVHTLFYLLILLLIFKKRKPILSIILSTIISTSIVTFGSMSMYTIHKTTYNIKTTKEITNTKFLSTWQRLRL